MEMKRTFYPVGQGAFYSEIFHLGSDCFSMVYDCGSGASLRSPGKALTSQIKNLKFPHETIDVLFISHFHADHINGITELSKKNTIKKIVIPLVDYKEFSLCEKYGDSRMRWFCKAVKDPRILFYNRNERYKTKLVIVKPVNLDERNRNSHENGIKRDNGDFEIDSVSKNIKIESGCGLSFYGIWKYIPFNYGEGSIKNELKKRSLIDDNGNPDLKKIPDIIDVYKEFFGLKNAGKEFNVNSLMVASVPYFDSHLKKFYCDCFCEYGSRYCNHRCIRCRDLYCRMPGCMYFGDSDLTKGKLSGKIELNNICDLIGTIQIPHHGSRHNFDDNMFSTFPNHDIDVISFGLGNRYRHPDLEVVKRILTNSRHLVLVTQNPYSTFCEHICLM